MNPGLILVDMDMVLTDFHGGFEKMWRQKFPEREVIVLENRKSFYLTKDYNPSFKDDIEGIINAERFLRDLSPLEGSIEGFCELVERYENVRICSTSLKNPYSPGEKREWVDAFLGRKAANELIICNDKTLIKAAYHH